MDRMGDDGDVDREVAQPFGEVQDLVLISPGAHARGGTWPDGFQEEGLGAAVHAPPPQGKPAN